MRDKTRAAPAAPSVAALQRDVRVELGNGFMVSMGKKFPPGGNVL